MKILRVALDVPLPQLFDYCAADAEPADVGRRAVVPFGAQGERVGLIVAVVSAADSDQPPEKLKTARAILRDLPPLPADWLELCAFVARYYHYPLGQVIGFALPPLLRQGKLPQARRAKAAPSGLMQIEPPLLLPEQQAALQRITATPGFAVTLLFGVTGSGKTEVYLRLIEMVIDAGRQALMLVPEIALTPQLEQRVRARFPHAAIVAAHSGLSPAARARNFIAAQNGQADIVLGTRLSVFMPLPRLALIVIDEEHDASFKQMEGLRYSARDVAIYRARQRNLPIVLGSATPSLETWRQAGQGRYQLAQLTSRALAAALPRFALVDTRRQKLTDGLSQSLLEALAATLERREQSLIFLNRRGYAPVLACPACGWISRCPRCAANLVVHLADRRLRCHHCGLERQISKACADCGNQDIHPFGRGTQRLEASLQARFPAARILRIDRDSAHTPAKWRALLTAIHEGAADILVGTQMLAKGHDFPRLTLVGVVGADAALFAADFRAPERLFAQLMQVGGRSGRADLPGRVLIQTEYPAHPLYRALIAQDYAGFARSLLDERAAAGFPPFTFQCMLRAESAMMAHSLEFLRMARALGHNLCAPPNALPVTLYDPVPMRLARRMNQERAQLLIEATQRSARQAFLTAWLPQLRALKAPRGLRWHIDVDPLEC